MKRCPECRKDYLDDSLLYCLDDGAALVQGTVGDEPATAIISGEPVSGASQTWPAKANDATGKKLDRSVLWPSLRERLPWLLVGALTFALMGLGAWLLLRPASARAPFVTLEVATPLEWITNPTSALSPDGTRLAFTASNAEQKNRLWVRHLVTGENQLLTDTEDAIEPFWSPDGTEIGFFTRDRLRVVNLATGRSRAICDVVGARRAGTWNAKGVIIFSTESGVPFRRVNADGKSEPADLSHGGFRPFFLPDGRHFLFGDRGQDTGVSIGLYLGDLESGEVREIRPDGAEPKFADGYLFFVLDRSLQAQVFDPLTFNLTGEPVTIAEIGGHSGMLGTNYSVSGNGLIAFRRSAAAQREIAWYARDGTRTVVGETDFWTNPIFSPDDSLIAIERGEGTAKEIWLLDGVRGTTRMFASGRPGGAVCPIWSADGRSIFYRKRRVGFVEKPLEGGSERAVISFPLDSDNNFMIPNYSQISADGRIIGFALRNGNREIIVQTPAGEEAIFAGSPANETQPALSPNEKWMAYVYREDEGTEVRTIFVDAFPNGGQRLRVSGDMPGTQPRWRRDGRELYFAAGNGQLMAVEVEESGGTLKLGEPKPLFQTRIPPSPGLGTRANYDASRDGSRFIVTEPKAEGGDDSLPITVLVNWTSLLKK